MNLTASTIVLRPRSVAEMMDLTCRLTFSQSLGIYLRIAALTLLPLYVAMLALKYAVGLDWLAIWLIALPLAVWVEGAFTIAASRILFGEQPTARAVMRLFGKRLWSYTGAMLIKAFYLALGLAMCGIGVFVMWPNGVLVPEASLLEGASASEAWPRSKRLVTQRASDSVAALFALIASQVGFVVGFEVLGQSLLDDILQLGHPFGEIWKEGGAPFALLGLFLAAPFAATARFLHYIDTRTRADGWDIQVKFMALLAKQENAT